jgi:hypothetical protein
MNFASAIRLARGLDTDICTSMSCLSRPRRPGVLHLPERLPSARPSRNVATNPPMSSTKSDTTTTFSSPSRPRPVHPRPLPKRDLPVVKVRFKLQSRPTSCSHPNRDFHQSRLPLLIGIGAIGLAAWGGFVLYATNLERASAAVTRQVLATVQRHPQVKELMGERVQVEESSWLSWASVFGGKGLGWISGSVRPRVKLVRVTVTLTV